MSIFYLILAFVWLIVCVKHWRDLLRIQFWIGIKKIILFFKCIFLGGVIIIGMIEKAVFYAEYSNMNLTGESIEGLLEVKEIKLN